MNRKTIDSIVSYIGLALSALLVVVGALAFWGYSFADTSVREQLVAQQIFFPEDGEGFTVEEFPTIHQWAGQQVDSGAKAEGYANYYIKAHLDAMAGGKTYSQVSGEWIAGGRTDAELGALRQTLFMGETLRGLLLNAYAFWQVGQIALFASLAAFVGGVVMFLLSLLGFRHARAAEQS
jgi:hypothetical protein